MNVVLIIKFSSTAMQGKRKLCECHTRYFSFLFLFLSDFCKTFFTYGCKIEILFVSNQWILKEQAILKEREREREREEKKYFTKYLDYFINGLMGIIFYCMSYINPPDLEKEY